jgi:hypothetical protein
LAVLTAWACVAAAAVLYWTRTVSFGEQARLGSIGISAFGVLMAAGWDAWMPDRFRARGHAALIALMTCLAVSLVPFLHGAYALPTAVAGEPAPDRPADAHYAAGMRVLGVDFPRGAAIDPGGSIPVRVYLSTDKVIDADYTMFLHLADDGQRLLYHYDGAPVGGRHPTRQWRPGSVFVDAFDVRSSDVPTDAALATLSLGFYPFEQPDRRLQAMDATGADIGDRIVLGRVRVHGKVPTAAAPPGSPVVEWANGIALAAVSVQRDAAAGPTGVDLTWTTDRTQQADYTVFAQVLDADNRILAQVDSQPLGGSWPTSTWRSGDVIRDALRWDSNPAGWRRLVVGLYGADGRRVPLTKPAGVFPDAAELASSP